MTFVFFTHCSSQASYKGIKMQRLPSPTPLRRETPNDLMHHTGLHCQKFSNPLFFIREFYEVVGAMNSPFLC